LIIISTTVVTWIALTRASELKSMIPVFSIPTSAIVGFYFAPRSRYSRLSPAQIFVLEKKRMDNDREIKLRAGTDRGDIAFVVVICLTVVLLIVVMAVSDLWHRGKSISDLAAGDLSFLKEFSTVLTPITSLFSLLTGIRVGAKDSM